MKSPADNLALPERVVRLLQSARGPFVKATASLGKEDLILIIAAVVTVIFALMI